MRSLYLTLLLLVSLCCRLSDAIFCYVCESVRDFRCLDPFDYQPFVQIDCSTLPFVRDKVPVFCEKRTEVFNGEYVTTRGCSVDYRWEDVQGYRDISGGQVPCIRRSGKETCLCSSDRCNAGVSWTLGGAALLALLSTLLL